MTMGNFLKSTVVLTEEIFAALTEGLPLGDAATARLARQLPPKYRIEAITLENSTRATNPHYKVVILHPEDASYPLGNNLYAAVKRAFGKAGQKDGALDQKIADGVEIYPVMVERYVTVGGEGITDTPGRPKIFLGPNGVATQPQQ